MYKIHLTHTHISNFSIENSQISQSLVGKVLITLNPFKDIEELHSNSEKMRYHNLLNRNLSDGNLPAHIYSIGLCRLYDNKGIFEICSMH